MKKWKFLKILQNLYKKNNYKLKKEAQVHLYVVTALNSFGDFLKISMEMNSYYKVMMSQHAKDSKLSSKNL